MCFIKKRVDESIKNLADKIVDEALKMNRDEFFLKKIDLDIKNILDSDIPHREDLLTVDQAAAYLKVHPNNR